MNKERGWVIVDPEFGALFWTYDQRRWGSILRFVNNHRHVSWKSAYRMGYGCVKATIIRGWK